MTIVCRYPGHRHPDRDTWSIDPVWSALEFEIEKLGLVTVKGRVPGFTGHDRGRRVAVDHGKRRRIDDHDVRRDPRRARPVARLLRYRALSRSSASSRPPSRPTATSWSSEGDLTIKDVTKPVELEGRFVGAGVDPYGNDRIGIELAGTVDRTEFGLNWNAPLPGGDFLLPNEVVLSANFAAVRAA